MGKVNNPKQVHNSPLLSSVLYRPTLITLRFALGFASVGLLLKGEEINALVFAISLGLTFAYLLRYERRATLFDVFFALAALLCAIGYLFNLFDKVVFFDKLTHVFMVFSVCLTLFFLLYEDVVFHRVMAKATSIFTLGVASGTLWEIFEWGRGLNEGLSDAMSDSVANSVGSFVAVLVVLGLRDRRY